MRSIFLLTSTIINQNDDSDSEFPVTENNMSFVM